MKIHRTEMGCLQGADKGNAETCKTSSRQLPVENHSGLTTPSQTPSEHHEPQVRKGRIAWPKMNDTKVWAELDEYFIAALQTTMRGSLENKAMQLPKVLYIVCEEQFGSVEKGDGTQCKQKPNRRQSEKGRLRIQQRKLRARLRECGESQKAGISVLLKEVSSRIQRLVKAERLRKQRKARRQNLDRFMKDPYGFGKNLFEQS